MTLFDSPLQPYMILKSKYHYSTVTGDIPETWKSKRFTDSSVSLVPFSYHTVSRQWIIMILTLQMWCSIPRSGLQA